MKTTPDDYTEEIEVTIQVDEGEVYITSSYPDWLTAQRFEGRGLSDGPYRAYIRTTTWEGNAYPRQIDVQEIESL